MKITAAFLLVTVSCFFVPAISNSIKCRKGCQQNPKWQSSCLEVSLINNLLPTINVLAEFICAYDKFKNAEDKSKLSTAIQNIETVTGCSLSNLLGSETTLDDLLMDVNGALQNLLKTVLHLLKGLKLESITTSMCGSLKPTLSKVLETLDYTPDGPEQDELTQTTGGEKRPTRDLLSNLLGGVTSIVPGLTGNANGCQGQQGGNGGILNVGGLVKDLPLVRQLLGGQNGGLLSILGLLQNVPVDYFRMFKFWGN
ncbi:uncharacterized protein O3C94_008640 [Discoglossus pictus]